MLGPSPRTLGLAGTCALALALVPTTADAASSARCLKTVRAVDGKVVKRSPSALAYARRLDGDGGRTVYGCAYATGRSTRLAAQDGEETMTVSKLTFAGTKLAFAVRNVEPAATNSLEFVGVADLKARRALGPIVDAKPVDMSYRGVQTAVVRLFVDRSGATAWSGKAEGVGLEGDQRSDAAIFTRAPRATPVQLDEGPNVDAASLALAGGTLSWTRGGATKTAPFPG